VWHVSTSLQRTGDFLIAPERCERIAIDLLAGVGGDIEWWLPAGEGNLAVTHLRVPTTPAEQLLIPPGLVTMDAGLTGPMRPRST